MGRGGSSPNRSPNDDRSDVMNPNNDAYWYDQTNRGDHDDDFDAGTSWTMRSDWDRRLDRSEGFERRIREADRVLKAAEETYFEASLPLDIAREAHSAARLEWGHARGGRVAHLEAETLWHTAAFLRRSPSESDSYDDEMVWMDADASPVEREKVVGLEAAAAAAVTAAEQQTEDARSTAGAAWAAAEAALRRHEAPHSQRSWDEEDDARHASLIDALEAAERLEVDLREQADEALRIAWGSYEAARTAYAEEYAASAVARARVKWEAAERAWAAAQDVCREPVEAWEQARAAHSRVLDDCGRAIDAAPRRGRG